MGDTTSSAPSRPGRARDADIDRRVLAAARRELAVHGLQAMSLTSIAARAGTTRQAIYRRWPSKADLAAAALHEEAEREPAPEADDPYSGLVAELASFAAGVSRPGRQSLVGTMLQESTAPELRAQYQARVVAPRRARIRHHLETAQRLGLVDADADLDVAVTLCTGSWYARALAGDPPPPDWPARTVALVWRAVGGHPSG